MKKKIYIDPGHSNIDPGAVGYVVERDLNEKVSKYMAEYLVKNYDCEVKVDPITNDSLSVIANAANKWGADLFVSNHFNAGGGNGYEALVYSLSRKMLGSIFEKHVKAIGQNSRGVKIRTDLGVLRMTNMPAILNEGAFVDNKKDIQDWDENSELKKLGEAYAKAAAEYLGIKRKTTESVKTPEKAQKKGKRISVLEWQKAAIKDGFSFPKYGADGYWGAECEMVARQAVVMWRSTFIYRNLTKLVQEYLGITADGLCGEETDEAIAKWQRENDLVADGAVGIRSWKKMLGV